MIHVLAAIGLLWVISIGAIGVGMLSFWIYDRSYQRRPKVKLPKANVRR